MPKDTLRKSMVIYIAIVFYLFLGILLFTNYTILSVGISLLFFWGAIGAYYKKRVALDSCLVILTIISLCSLITLSPLDIDLSPDEIDDYMKGFTKQLTITVIFYLLWLAYFYCLSAIRQYLIKHIVLVYIFFFFVTVMVVNLLESLYEFEKADPMAVHALSSACALLLNDAMVMLEEFNPVAIGLRSENS